MVEVGLVAVVVVVMVLVTYLGRRKSAGTQDSDIARRMRDYVDRDNDTPRGLT